MSSCRVVKMLRGQDDELLMKCYDDWLWHLSWWLIMMFMLTNDYDVYVDEWLWSLGRRMIMMFMLMKDYEVVYNDWLRSGLRWWCLC
jgi:hypothetical protein